MKEHGQNRTDRDTNGTFRVWKTNLMMGLTSLELERALFGNALLPWQSYRNGKPESSVICQYVCQSVLFVQPIRSLIWFVC